jgi:hypothetical protein
MGTKPFLLNPGCLTEIRFLGPRKWSLFSANSELIAATLQRAEVAGFNAYQTLNPLADGTPERRGAVRDVLFCAQKGQLTANTDVARRKFLLLDSDSVKPTGAAATEAQRSAAHAHSATLEEAFSAEGWPRPIVSDSGNGAHRLYKLDLPNDREADFLISNLLHVTARKFDTDAVKLDKTVSNAGRVTRLYGSRNHKAQRDSAVLYVPNPIITVSAEQIKVVIEKWRGGLGFTKPLAERAGDWTPERMEAFLNAYSIDYRPAVPIPAGLLWVLSPCPFNADHVGSSPAVILTKRGWPKFRCLHNSCSGLRWADFCKRLHRLTGKWFVYVP